MNYDIDTFDWDRLPYYRDECVLTPKPLDNALTQLLTGKRLPTVRYVRYFTPAERERVDKCCELKHWQKWDITEPGTGAQTLSYRFPVTADISYKISGGGDVCVLTRLVRTGDDWAETQRQNYPTVEEAAIGGANFLYDE